MTDQTPYSKLKPVFAIVEGFEHRSRISQPAVQAELEALITKNFRKKTETFLKCTENNRWGLR